MDDDDVLLLAGQVLGLLARLTPEELERAARSPGLCPRYRDLLLELARLRLSLTAPAPAP